MARVSLHPMLPLHRTALYLVATAVSLAALWLLIVAVPELIDRHRDGALAEAVLLIAAVPAGFLWGATRLVLALRDIHDD
ncbi:MAG: hypothetical protein H7243_11605 [Sphingomonadaceae bacterium]|nr:hypothetical protein [Sphingomonadaceae bacterium]